MHIGGNLTSHRDYGETMEILNTGYFRYVVNSITLDHTKICVIVGYGIHPTMNGPSKSMLKTRLRQWGSKTALDWGNEGVRPH